MSHSKLAQYLKLLSFILFTFFFPAMICLQIVLTDFSTDFICFTYSVLTLKNFFFSFYKVLILEPTKIYQPSYLSINSEAEEKTVSIWHVLPDDKVLWCCL